MEPNHPLTEATRTYFTSRRDAPWNWGAFAKHCYGLPNFPNNEKRTKVARQYWETHLDAFSRDKDEVLKGKANIEIRKYTGKAAVNNIVNNNDTNRPQSPALKKRKAPAIENRGYERADGDVKRAKTDPVRQRLLELERQIEHISQLQTRACNMLLAVMTELALVIDEPLLRDADDMLTSRDETESVATEKDLTDKD